MAWNAPATVVQDQLMAAAFWNQQVRDDHAELRAGGIAIASQAAEDLIVGASATQLGRVASSDGVPYFNGSAWTFVDTVADSYPVGSVYISTAATNPNTLFGVGTWAALGTGRVLVGLNPSDPAFDTVEETSGAKTHTLMTSEIAVHSHGVNDPGHQHHVGANRQQIGSGPFTRRIPRGYPGPSGNVTAQSVSAGITIQDAGGGAAHNNLAPYIVVYIWKRTA